MSDITSLMGGFDAEGYTEQPEFDNSPLPLSDYYAEIEKAEIKKTKAGTGTLCEVTFSILGDVHTKAHQKRKIWARFNLQNPSAMCQQIGQSQFHGLRLAVGKAMATDTDELLQQKLVIRVVREKGTTDKVEISKYMALEGYEKPEKVEPQAGALPASATAVSTPAKKKNPWD